MRSRELRIKWQENSKKIENNMKIITLEDMLLSKIPVFLSSSTQDFTVS